MTLTTRSLTTRARKFTTLKLRLMRGPGFRSTFGSILVSNLMPIQSCPNCGAKNRVNETLALAHKPICGKCGAQLDNDGREESKPLTVTDASFATDVIA